MASSSSNKFEPGSANAAKRLRLNEMGRASYVSERGKASLCKEIKDTGMPSACTRTTFARARQGTCAEQTPFGKIVQPLMLPLAKGDFEVYIQHPLAMLHYCALECKPFRDFMFERVSLLKPTPEKPWEVILYTDEIGRSPLSGKDTREVQACYWAFKQFGQAALTNERTWFTIAAIRSDVIKKLPGGMSHFTSLLLKLFFDPETYDLRHGVFLPLGENGAPVLVIARFGNFVADEKALKDIYHFRGASAWFPCPMCINVVKLGGGGLIGESVFQTIDMFQ
jgi:hypothetical protein